MQGLYIEEEVKRYLRPLIKRQVDTMVLCCTHYPLIHQVIADALGDGVSVISSDQEVAREVEENLHRRGYLRSSHNTPAYRFMCSGSVEQAIRLGRLFLGPEVEWVEKVELPLGGVLA